MAIRWKSTRSADAAMVSLSEAIGQGLASDGGLFVPERLPRLQVSDFDGLSSLPDVAGRFLKDFFSGDSLEGQLSQICSSAFDFAVPLRSFSDGPRVLELFHGPTAAFKDFGARFLAQCLVRTRSEFTVLVATSGDTGGAVAAAFWKLKGAKVVVLFPEGRVSPRQQKQLTAWGENIRALSVRGDFDDCQRLVKAAFQEPALRDSLQLTSANSINAGRLLPQAAYYVHASLAYFRETGRPLSFFIPTGNLGNALSALWAREAGLPIGKITLCTNANRSLSEFYRSGTWKAFPTEATLANAMDVGNPSNLERLLTFQAKPSELVAHGVGTERVDDDAIRDGIQAFDRRWSEAICPHTATAYQAWVRQGEPKDSALVSTAHPAKFETIVEPLLGYKIPVPSTLDFILTRTEKFTTIDPELDALRTELRKN